MYSFRALALWSPVNESPDKLKYIETKLLSEKRHEIKIFANFLQRKDNKANYWKENV